MTGFGGFSAVSTTSGSSTTPAFVPITFKNTLKEKNQQPQVSTFSFGLPPAPATSTTASKPAPPPCKNSLI
jgi:hypothetical protein